MTNAWAEPDASALAFVAAVEAKCHAYRSVAGDRHHPGKRQLDDYHKVKLTEAELQGLSAITGRCEIFVLPTSTAFGFAPAFMVVEPVKPYPDVPASLTVLAKFEERQLPEGWDFDRVAATMFPNARQVAFYELEFSRERADYDY